MTSLSLVIGITILAVATYTLRISGILLVLRRH